MSSVQPPLDRRVNVLVAVLKLKLAAFKLTRDVLQPAHDFVGFGFRQHAGLRQRARPGDAAAHILLRQALVEWQRIVQLRHRCVHSATQPSCPEFHCQFLNR